MAKISTYALDTDIRGGDKLVGTDAGAANATKNFTLDKVADFLNTTKIQSASIRYGYQDVGAYDERQPGTISFASSLGANVPFESFNQMILSGQTQQGGQVSDYYTAPLIGSIVLLSNALNPSNWAVYKWINSVENLEAGQDFYTITLDYVNSVGQLVKNKDYFITMLLYDYGEYGGDKTYAYPQDNASDVWVVTHNMNKYPSVSVVDSAGSTVVGDVLYDSLNQVTITFSAPFSGKAFFN
jgi:hypothetical protein